MVEKKVINGVNVGDLVDTINAVKDKPVIAKFRFQAKNKWHDGGLNRTVINDFYGTQKELTHQQTFELDADEPPLLLGKDRGPNPVEYLLTALASCVTTAMVYHAAGKGIEIRSVESVLEGDLDLQGFLGTRDDVRQGYNQIRMRFKIDADVPENELEEILQLGTKFSPTFDSIANGVPIKVELQK